MIFFSDLVKEANLMKGQSRWNYGKLLQSLVEKFQNFFPYGLEWWWRGFFSITWSRRALKNWEATYDTNMMIGVSSSTHLLELSTIHASLVVREGRRRTRIGHWLFLRSRRIICSRGLGEELFQFIGQVWPLLILSFGDTAKLWNLQCIYMVW